MPYVSHLSQRTIELYFLLYLHALNLWKIKGTKLADEVLVRHFCRCVIMEKEVYTTRQFLFQLSIAADDRYAIRY